MNYAIAAKTRTNLGRRAKDALKERRVPAVLYGSGVEAKPISVSEGEFLKTFKAAGHSSLVDVTLDTATPVKAIIKEIQVDPLTMQPIHVDFHQVRMDKEIEAKIPLKFVGVSEAVTVGAGTLIKSIDEMNVRCLPGDLPHEIEVDLSVLKTFEDSITVESIKAPKGVTFLTEPGLTIASVDRPLTEDELKKLEENQVGDVTAVKSEADEKKAAEEAKKAAEAAEATPEKKAAPAAEKK